MTKQEVLARIDRVIALGDECLKKQIKRDEYSFVPAELHVVFKSAAYEMVTMFKGIDSQFYRELQYPNDQVHIVQKYSATG